MNKNFLNNQNYILGKTEKKKLLSKFFVENNILFFLNLFNNIKIIFEKKIDLGNNVFIAVYLWLFTIFFIIFYGKNFIYLILSIFVPIFIIFILKYLAIKKANYSRKLIEISTFKDLFFRKELNIYGTFFYMFIFLGLPLTGFFNLLFLDTILGLYFLGSFVIAFILKKYIKKFLKIKFLFLIFSPVLIILEIFIGTYYYFKFIVFGIKGFKITKLSFRKNLLTKFLLLNKNYGENLFYKIEKKQKKLKLQRKICKNILKKN